MLTQHLALDLAAEHITVNAVAPGPFETKMMAHVFNDPDRSDALKKRVPLHRSGEPDDAAGSDHFPGVARRLLPDRGHTASVRWHRVVMDHSGVLAGTCTPPSR